MENCLFCNIVAGEIPSTKVYEDDTVLAFRDTNPQAPVHILVIPKMHIGSIAEINGENIHAASRCLEVIGKIAGQEGLSDGFRVISNCGQDGGQSVPHLHFHILGGKDMGEKLV